MDISTVHVYTVTVTVYVLVDISTVHVYTIRKILKKLSDEGLLPETII